MPPTHTPTPTPTPSTSTSNTNTNNVTLIVKAPNQSIQDHIVICPDTWTVYHIKTHLTREYHNHPRIEDQKLIYSGQLLADTVVLKDILRHFEGQDTHTFHLVCAVPHKKTKPPPNKPDSSSSVTQNTSNQPSTGDDGVRRRNIEETQQPTTSIPRTNPLGQNVTQGNQFPQPYYWDNNHINMWSNLTYQWANQGNYQMNPSISTPPMMMPTNVDPTALGAQIAWIQQLQTQYMQFYSQLLQSSGATIGPMPTNPINIEISPPVNQEQPNANIQEAANNQLNNVNNNQNFQNDLDNWDWLDWFHMMSRLMLMFAVVYFYSSPPRFLLVVTAGYLIYLYQIGYFQGFFNYNNINNNNNENADNNANQANIQPEQENEQEEEGSETSTDTTVREENVPQNNTPEQPSFLSLSWTIISSFITSILPENPAAI